MRMQVGEGEARRSHQAIPGMRDVTLGIRWSREIIPCARFTLRRPLVSFWIRPLPPIGKFIKTHQ